MSKARESQIEQDLIAKLGDLKYSIRPDIRGSDLLLECIRNLRIIKQ